MPAKLSSTVAPSPLLEPNTPPDSPSCRAPSVVATKCDLRQLLLEVLREVRSESKSELPQKGTEDEAPQSTGTKKAEDVNLKERASKLDIKKVNEMYGA